MNITLKPLQQKAYQPQIAYAQSQQFIHALKISHEHACAACDILNVWLPTANISFGDA